MQGNHIRPEFFKKQLLRKRIMLAMALRGRTNRQVFINKDRKTTPRELVDIKKENTPQLKIIISIYSHRGCCTFLFFIYFYSALISDRRRRDCKLPPLAPVLSMGWRVKRYRSADPGSLSAAPSRKTPESRWGSAPGRRRAQPPSPPELPAPRRCLQASAHPDITWADIQHISTGGGVDTQRREDEAEPLHNTHT